MAVKGKYEGANKPLVSVVMTSFNEKKEIIDKAILSILNQTYENFELLIFDDSTNVETKDAIDFYRHDPRVRVFRFSERLGFVKSLNRGLQEAKGDYIARMDGDDISLPIRFEKEVEYLEKNKDVSVIGGQINIINEYGVTISFRKYPQV